MDYFNETSNCRVLDYCNDEEDDTLSEKNAIALNVKGDITAATLTEIPAAATLSKCNQWVPSEEEPGSCTNKQMPSTWPLSMIRATYSECCRDFFGLEKCSVVDVCGPSVTTL